MHTPVLFAFLVGIGASDRTADGSVSWSPIRAEQVNHEARKQAGVGRSDRSLIQFETGYGRVVDRSDHGLPAAPTRHGPMPKGPVSARGQGGRELTIRIVDEDQTLAEGCAIDAIGTSSAGPASIDLDQSGRPQTARLPVFTDQPSFVSLTFDSPDPDCLAQGLELANIWPAADQEIVLDLERRPLPEIRILDSAGAEIDYFFAAFCLPDRSFCTAVQEGSSRDPGLVAGERYVASILSSAARHTPAIRDVTAVPGPFEVGFDVERVISVDVSVDLPWGTLERGLLEFRRGGTVVSAHEIGPAGIEAEVPAGDYDLRLSGLAGRSGEDGSHFVLRSRRFQHTITGSSPSLPLEFEPPSGQVAMTGIPAPGIGAVVLENGIPVAAIPDLEPGSVLRTDFDRLELILRGPGLDDRTAIVTDTEGAVLDVGALASLPSVLGGRVVDPAGRPMAGAPVYLWAEDGVAVSRFETGPDGGFSIPAVRGATATFGATVDGNTVATHYRILDPNRSADLTVVQQALAFEPLTAAGPPAQRIAGDELAPFRVVFVAESYVAEAEPFDDLNGNGVWDGRLFLDFNGDGIWQHDEPLSTYGERTEPPAGGDPSADNEPFEDLNGDGYPNVDDFAVFERNVQNYLRSLLATPLLQQTRFEIEAWTLFLPSNQAGMDIEGLVTADTRFGASYDAGRNFLDVDAGAVFEALGEHFDRFSQVVVLINQPVRIGRENSFILAGAGLGHISPNDHASGHEFGHTPGRLIDEYDEFRGTDLRPRLPRDHMTSVTDPALAPWHDQIARADVPIAVPGTSGVGLYAGGRYQSGGVYRPTSNSRMRHLALDFNEPAREIMSDALCRLAHEAVPAPPVSGTLTAAEAPERLRAQNGCRLEVSGAWYDPAQPGHGWLIERLAGVGRADPDRINVYWYVYRAGQPVWLVGTGDLVGNRARIDLLLTSGADFPPRFASSDVVLEPWGELSFEFRPGGSATASWDSILDGFGSGSLELARLSRIPDLPQACRSGSYFAPDQSGHGIVVEVFRAAGQLQLLVAWYAYLHGEQVWLLGQGPLVDDRAEIRLEAFSGADFPPEFRSGDVTRVPWGRLAIGFSGPGSASIEWDADLPGFDDGALALTQLTTLDERRCMLAAPGPAPARHHGTQRRTGR